METFSIHYNNDLQTNIFLKKLNNMKNRLQMNCIIILGNILCYSPLVGKKCSCRRVHKRKQIILMRFFKDLYRPSEISTRTD